MLRGALFDCSALCVTAFLPRKYAGVVPGYIEHLEPLQVQVAVQGLDEHLSRREQGTKGPGPEGNCWVELEVHALGYGLQGLKAWARAGRR